MTVRTRELLGWQMSSGRLNVLRVLPRVGFQAGSFHHERNS